MTSFQEGQRRSTGLPRSSSRHSSRQDEEAEQRATLAVAEAVDLARGKGLLPSPTELCVDLTRTCKTLPPLRWHHWDYMPYKMRLTNTGCTVMVSAKWRSKVRAHLTGGPLLGRYVFSQLHFHWGQEDTEGSEHTLEGESFPLEMHMVLFKSRYLTQEAALKEIDGVVEVAYFFQLTKKDNPLLEPLVGAMSKVKCAMKSTRFGPVPLAQLIPSFSTDYLMYMGSLLTGKCAHAVTWIVQHQPLLISKRQLKALRSVQGLDGNPLLRNWRKAHPPMGRTVLHVLPSHSKITHQGDDMSEVPRESRQTRFSPDWSENEPSPEESPRKGRRFFGCFGKKNQDAREEVVVVGSSGDSEFTDTSSNQFRLPKMTSHNSYPHLKVSDSTFRAMCEASLLLSMSSSSQHSSTAGEDAHDRRQETAGDGYTERGHDVTDATKRRPLDVGFILLQPLEHRRTVGAAFFNPSDRRHSFGIPVTYLDPKDHDRSFMRPFNTLLSEVEEESDRISEAVGDSAGYDSGSGVVAPEGRGLLHTRLPPLKSHRSVLEHKHELSTMKNKDLDVGGNDDSRLPAQLSKCSLNLPQSSSDSLLFELSSPHDQDSAISLLTVVNEDPHGNKESDDIKLLDRSDCKHTELVHCVQVPSPSIPIFHRSSKRGISWWVPLHLTVDDNGNDADVSSRDDVQPYPVDKLSLVAANNCFLGEEILSDTSSTTDSPRTEITACQKRTDVLSDFNQSTAQHSSEQQALATIRRSKISDPGFKDMKNIDSLGVSGRKDTPSKNANALPTSDAPSSSLYPDMSTNVSIYPEEKCQTNDSDVSPTRSTKTCAQKRFEEEELRFPEIRNLKRNNRKPKVQRKKTSLSLSSLQRTTKDGKVKDRLNSWREIQTRKRNSRKNENKKPNRSKRRHHSWSSMDHLFLGSSSEDRSKLEKKASKTTKTSDTVFADGKTKKDGHDYQRLERSNSSSSVSSMFSNNGGKCMDKVVKSGGIQELIGSGDEMELQEISFLYVPSHAAAAPLNRKHLMTAAEQGDTAVGKSPSTLRIHLKAPVDVKELLKKVPSGSYVTIERPGAYVQEREVTVGMVLVDTLRCEERTETNTSSANETNVEASQTYHEKSEDNPLENSKNLSTSAPAGDCGNHECVPDCQQKSVVDNSGTNKMESSKATASSISTIERHSPCRKRCCNAECWICQLSTLKVIQYTQGLDHSRDLPTSENSERAVENTPIAVKHASNEDETAAVANVSSNAVQRFSSVVSRTLGIVECSASNERVPLPEPGPVGDVPLEENRRVAIALPTSQNDITKPKDISSVDSKVYRTTMELQLYSDGTILGGNSNSSSSGGERMTESSDTSKEVLSEGRKVPHMALHCANSSSCEEASNIVKLLTANNENKAADAAQASTEIIDIYRKIKRRPQRKMKLSVEGIPESPNTDGLSSYTSCATESDVSLIPDEEEAVPQSSNTQSLASGEEIPTRQNQGVKCIGMCEEDGRNSISYRDHKTTLRRFKLEYEILSKVMLYATLRQLGIASASVPSGTIAQPSSGNETCGRNEPDHIGAIFQPSLCVGVVSSVSKVPDSQLVDPNTKSTAPEDIHTTTREQSAPQQALAVSPVAESQRNTEDIEELQQSVSDDDDGSGGISGTNCSNTQLLATTSKTEIKSKSMCTSGSVKLCTKNDTLPSVVEENASNDTEAESVADSQETRDVEGFDLSTSSVSTSATRRRPKNKNESCKTSSTASSAKGKKLCSVEVRDKSLRPDSEPKKNQRPCSEPKKNLRPGSEPQKSNRPVRETQQNRRPKGRTSRDRILSPREVYERRKMYAQTLALRRTPRGNLQAGSEDWETLTNFEENQSVSDGKSVLASTAGKTATDKKAKVMRRMSENIKAGKDASPCSTCSTKTNSILSGAKGKAVNDSTGIRNDINLPAARERSMKKTFTGQCKGDSIKGAHAANAPRAVAVNGANGPQGRGLKSNAVNDATERKPTSRKQSKKSLRRKTSPDGATELRNIDVIDKPSLCETWLKQHYSDSSNHGSVCGSTSIETAVETVILRKRDTKPIAAGNPGFDSEGSGTTNETIVCLKYQAAGGTEGQIPTLPKPGASLPSQKGEGSTQSNGELIPCSGDSGTLMIPYRAEALPLLTYRPQNTQVADSPSSPTDVGGMRKKAKPLSDQSDGNTPTNISHPPSVPDRKSVATSPILLRRNNVTLQDSHQISLTVETLSFCSTGVNTSLSVTHLSSRSMGVQCPSRSASKRPSTTTDIVQSIMVSEVKRDTQVPAASGMHAMLNEVATKLENHQLLVQKSVATQWLRHASVPNLAFKSTEKKMGKQTKRGSSNKRQGGASKSALGQYDLGLNEVQMEMVRAIHRRRMFRAFSTNSLALGTNEASAKRVLRRLFRKRKKKVKSDAAEGKSKSRPKKKKKDEEEEGQPAAAVAAKAASGFRVVKPFSRTGFNTERTAWSGATHSDVQSDAEGRVRKDGERKVGDSDEKGASQQMVLVRGAETPQRPALFEDLEGVSPAGTGRTWCSCHGRPVEDAAQAATDGDSDEVSAAVAQVNTGARVLRVSLADDESTGCADLGSVEFVMRGSETTRQPTKSPSVLERLRRMLTWRS